MKLVLLFGPQAVGKMTVGQELAKITELKLFHNHMTIDLVSHFFDYGTKRGQDLVNSFRHQIFEEVAKSDLEGLIFTFVWRFDKELDWNYVKNVVGIFEAQGADIYYVELEADFEERLARNVTPNRLEHKPFKRNLEWSRNDVITTAEKFRLNSLPGELSFLNYLRLDTMNKSAEATAHEIKKCFQF
ncbi:AAA family ATPase [Chryseomicrobium sp. FSL W7-1435]|uniref:AAA family ATPase n=1 Tax=Chryseomicrobium sp. FSL W7-1435 TaxID=2921704 RepID=UPI00315B3099